MFRGFSLSLYIWSVVRHPTKTHQPSRLVTLSPLPLSRKRNLIHSPLNPQEAFSFFLLLAVLFLHFQEGME
jgi:hypothetical protein